MSAQRCGRMFRCSIRGRSQCTIVGAERHHLGRSQHAVVGAERHTKKSVCPSADASGRHWVKCSLPSSPVGLSTSPPIACASGLRITRRRTQALASFGRGMGLGWWI
jgi:hypothetical protein